MSASDHVFGPFEAANALAPATMTCRCGWVTPRGSIKEVRKAAQEHFYAFTTMGIAEREQREREAQEKLEAAQRRLIERGR